jgi:L-alanine-DL-glutamate epimerase-like enolase superfamily enzyme
MEITDVETIRFTHESRYTSDEKGHGHPGEPHETTSTLTHVAVADGPDGYCFGGRRSASDIASERLVGENPLHRERLWNDLYRTQRLNRGAFTDSALAAVDCALYDVAGKRAEMPVYELLGAARTEVPAYASTMVGDDDPDGLGTVAAYVDFAQELVDRGFGAIKLHSWMPPFDADPDRVVEMCRAVREAVGPGVDLMLDSHHYYTRTEAKRIGDALADLNFLWFEEPMDEHSLSAYEWLTDAVEVAILGPETAEGKMQTRAEWASRGIGNIGRVGVFDVGGITPARKTAALYESFCLTCEPHGNSIPELHHLCSMPIEGRYFEYGLLHPNYDYERYDRPYLNSYPYPEDGVVEVPDSPGLGYDIDWDLVEENRIDA